MEDDFKGATKNNAQAPEKKSDIFSPIFTPDEDGNPGDIFTVTPRKKSKDQDGEGQPKASIIYPSVIIFDPNL